MTLLEEFGQFIEGSYQTTFSQETLHSARRALLDWHGALIAGADTDAASRLRDAYSEEFGAGQCSVAGSQKKVFARAAAFMNGTISHIAEFDDIFRDGAYHPACPTISAAFALAESRNDSLDNLLHAIIIGYEVSTRISKVIQPSHYRYFHTTGTTVEVSAGISINNWVQVCVTYSTATSTVILYKNGYQVGSTATSVSSIVSSTFNGVIGDEDATITTPFKGNISNLQIYNRPLSATEILQNFQATRTRFGV
jgi:hypothetical protein